MAIAGASILDGTYTKIIELTSDNVAADATQAFTFVGLGMTAFGTGLTPITYHITSTSTASLATGGWQIQTGTVTVNGFTARRVAGANTSESARAVFRYIHSVDR